MKGVRGSKTFNFVYTYAYSVTYLDKFLESPMPYEAVHILRNTVNATDVSLIAKKFVSSHFS